MSKKAPKKNKITADILSFEKGSEHFEGLRAIRIVSKKYNLMIMDDYLPMIGELEGNLTLIPPQGMPVEYENVSGFYSLAHNTFEFILKGKLS